jgi:hypothetical protein
VFAGGGVVAVVLELLDEFLGAGFELEFDVAVGEGDVHALAGVGVGFFVEDDSSCFGALCCEVLCRKHQSSKQRSA